MSAYSNSSSMQQWLDYPERLDVRTPAEYAQDHLPGALNYPVLSNEERVLVGTTYKQQSSFIAKRLGAALIARNIAYLLETAFAEKPKHWAPLIYCWRGGKRSGAMCHILREIGWHAVQLEGGYRGFRQQVMQDLCVLPTQFHFRVIGGLTGTGKSRLLAVIAAEGGQTLDLEGLAQHRGSLLGGLPATPQPSQKRFETLLWEKLVQFNPAQPVFIESESAKVGNLTVPQPLLQQMRQGLCYQLTLPLPERVTLLTEEYAHFLTNPSLLRARLQYLVPWQGRTRVARWEDLIQQGAWPVLIGELLTSHYDPLYQRGIEHHFIQWSQAQTLTLTGIRPEDYRTVAQQLLQGS